MTTRRLLPCSCGATTPVEVAQAGQRIRCQCGAELTVPTLRGLRSLEQEVVAEGPRKRVRRWTPRQGALFTGGLIGAALAFFIAAYFGLVYSTANNNRAAIESRMAQMGAGEHIDGLSPSELLEEWKLLRQERLEGFEATGWRELGELAEEMKVSFAVAIAVAIAGLLIAASALVIRPAAPAEQAAGVGGKARTGAK